MDDRWWAAVVVLVTFALIAFLVWRADNHPHRDDPKTEHKKKGRI